jgi:hypothetical protein
LGEGKSAVASFAGSKIFYLCSTPHADTWGYMLSQFDFNQPLDPNSFVMEAFKSGS